MAIRLIIDLYDLAPYDLPRGTLSEATSTTGAAMSCIAVVAAAMDRPLPMRSAIVLLKKPFEEAPKEVEKH